MTSGEVAARQDPAALPASLLLAGAGKMGGALLEGWLALGLDGECITVIDPQAADGIGPALAGSGITINPTDPAGQPPEVMILAIKPQMLESAAPSLAAHAGPETLLISVVAGKTITDLRRAFPKVRAVVRAMPNTPAAIRRGITGVTAGADVSARQRATVQALLEAVGQVEWLANEELIDAVTAVSGSGPAYVFHLVECLAKAGEAAGLDPAAAQRLARATVEGAGALMAANASVSPETLRQNVTSPGGTTAAALQVLMGDPGLGALLTRAVAAAKTRAGELAG